jgi:hypothetical protein
MSESNPVDILPTPDAIRKPWIITDRPFSIDKSKQSPIILNRYQAEGIACDNELGFSEEEISEWKNKQHPILEIGPGEGVSSQQLLDKGVNLFVIEPTLGYPIDSPQSKRAVDRFLSEEFQGRVSSVIAADAPLAFPDRKFRAAFAIGVNFQSYSQTELDLLKQIRGVLDVLEDTPDSYFAFQIAERGWLNLDYLNIAGNRGRKFNLIQFLNDNNIRYDPPRKFLSSRLVE